MPKAVRVANPNADIPRRRALELLLESLLEPPEVGPPQEAGNQEGQRGIGYQGECSLVGRDGRACDDQRLADGNDHEQRMSLGHVAHVDVPRAPAGACVASRSVRIASTQISGRIEGSASAPTRTSTSPIANMPAQRQIPAARGRSSAPSRREPGGRDRGCARRGRGSANHTASSRNACERVVAITNAEAVGRKRDDSNNHMGRVGRVERPGELGPRPPDHPEQDRERSTPSGVRLWAVSAVTWVTANTKTRSKKSSTNATLCASGACSRGRATGAVVAKLREPIGSQPGSNVNSTSWLDPPLVWRTSTGPTPRA